MVRPHFRYRAVMADGVVENEICPVYVGVVSGEARPDPTEVDSVAWVAWAPFRASVLNGEYDVSPWCREQLEALGGEQPVARATGAAFGPPTSY